jgi:hypothetical protein
MRGSVCVRVSEREGGVCVCVCVGHVTYKLGPEDVVRVDGWDRSLGAEPTHVPYHELGVV